MLFPNNSRGPNKGGGLKILSLFFCLDPPCPPLCFNQLAMQHFLFQRFLIARGVRHGDVRLKHLLRCTAKSGCHPTYCY